MSDVRTDSRVFLKAGVRVAAVVSAMALFLGILGGCVSSLSYSYQAVFPSNYKLFRDEGTRERFVSQQAVGPRNSANSYSAGISVTVAPEAVEGGEFDEPADQLKYLLKSMNANAANFSLAQNDVIQLDGVPANRVSFSYDIPNGISLVTHVREEILFAKRGTELYTIVFSVDEGEWASRRPEYDAFLNSFRWRR